MIKVFFSYCHKDEDLRNELEKHLSILKRQNIIASWHDRRIGAGSDFAQSINQELESADVILLLISSDFLASDYCYDIEMTRAMQRHEANQAKVIPVILRPCNWHNAPFGKLMATPTDGKPVTKHADIDEAFLDVTNAIEKVATNLSSQKNKEKSLLSSSNHNTTQPNINSNAAPRSSNLRVKQTFTQQQKDEFLDQSFEYMASFFENSLNELANRNPQLSGKFKRIDANRFTAVIYQDGQSVAQCGISLRGLRGSGISYSGDISSHSNSFNESLSIADDGYMLYLKPLMNMGFNALQSQNTLSQQYAAEYYWSTLIDRLQ